MSDRGFTVDMTQPGMRDRLAMASCIARLRIETRTKLKSRINTLQAAKHNWPEICTGRTRKEVLAQLEAHYEKVVGHPYGQTK